MASPAAMPLSMQRRSATAAQAARQGFSGLLAEEDDLLPVVLGAPPPPKTLDQIINEAAVQHARPAPAPLTQVPSIVGNTESGSSAEVDEQQSGLIGEGAATMEHEIGNVLEALLMHAESAASEQEAARAGPHWESAHYTPEGSAATVAKQQAPQLTCTPCRFSKRPSPG